MSTVSNAVATRDAGQQIIAQYADDFALVLPSQVRPATFVRLSQGLLRRNEDLAKVVQRNPGSFLAALLDCARLGLEPGETYHFVPFGSEVVGIVDYTGEIELIYRAGAVSSVKVEVVYERDDFGYEPDTMDRPRHRPNWFGERGKMIGAYGYCVMKDGAVSQVVVMSAAEIGKVKAVSKTANRSDSPWKLWEDRMWKKTIVKQLSKWVPQSPEYAREAARAQAEVERIRSVSTQPIPQPAVDHADPDTDVIHDAELVEEYTHAQADKDAAADEALPLDEAS